MVHVAPGTPIKWSDLRYLTYAADSGNLSDSAYSIKNPKVLEYRFDAGSQAVYGGTGYSPTEILEGQHSYELDFEAQVTGPRPFFTASGADTTYVGTNVQTVFYVDMVFSDCPGDSAFATRWFSVRFKGCRFRNIRARAQGLDVIMSGTITAQDVKQRGVPTGE